MYAVDLDLLDETVARLEAAHARLEALDAELRSRIARLPAGWDGVAAAAHAGVQARWSDAFADLRDALQVMRVAADTAHGNYAQAVTTNLDLWRQVDS